MVEQAVIEKTFKLCNSYLDRDMSSVYVEMEARTILCNYVICSKLEEFGRTAKMGQLPPAHNEGFQFLD